MHFCDSHDSHCSDRTNRILLKLKDEFDQVRAYKATGDKLVVQRVAFKQSEVYKESGMSMLPMSLMPFVQIPVALGMFFSVKHLCGLLLERFHRSDILFLPGLMAPDPYYVLCRDCNTVILYLLLSIHETYMIQSNRNGSM